MYKMFLPLRRGNSCKAVKQQMLKLKLNCLHMLYINTDRDDTHEGHQMFHTTNLSLLHKGAAMPRLEERQVFIT